jgi:hypothetical protein
VVCVNRRHRRPHLAAFGAAADRDAFDFGMTHGASCAGACWALMLQTLLVGNGHVLWMIAITLFVFAEQLENPAPLGMAVERSGKGPARRYRAGAHETATTELHQGSVDPVCWAPSDIKKAPDREVAPDGSDGRPFPPVARRMASRQPVQGQTSSTFIPRYRIGTMR